MTEKLTLQDCYKYCKANIFRYDSQLGVKINEFENIQEFIELSTYHDLIAKDEIINCKLILRDISKLTDEEKRHIHKYYLAEDLYKITTNNNSVVYNSFQLLLSACSDKIGLIDYLRSINIDIDNFIKSGKAVKNAE